MPCIPNLPLVPGTGPGINCSWGQSLFFNKTGFQQRKVKKILAGLEQGKEGFAYGGVIFNFIQLINTASIPSIGTGPGSFSQRLAANLHVQIFLA